MLVSTQKLKFPPKTRHLFVGCRLDGGDIALGDMQQHASSTATGVADMQQHHRHSATL
jgi:hypothetical protein